MIPLVSGLVTIIQLIMSLQLDIANNVANIASSGTDIANIADDIASNDFDKIDFIRSFNLKFC